MNVHLGLRRASADSRHPETQDAKENQIAQWESHTELPPQLRELLHQMRLEQRTSHRHMQQRKKEAETASLLMKKFQSLYDNAPLAFVIVDRGGVLAGANRAARVMLCTTAERMIRKPFKRYLKKGSYRLFNRFFKRLTAGEEVTCDVTLASPQQKLIQLTASVNRDFVPGKTFYTLGFVEITQHVHTQNALKSINDRLRTLIESSRQINSSLDINTIMRRLVCCAMDIVDGSSGAAGFFQNEEMVFREYNSKGKVSAVFFRFRAGEGVPGHVMQTRKPYIVNEAGHDEHVIAEVRKTLKFYNLIDVPILSKKGELLGCFEIHNKRRHQRFDSHDQIILQGLAAGAAVALENARLVEAYRKAEERVKISEFNYRTLVENANSIIMRWNPEGVITFINPFAGNFLGYNPNEVIGRPITMLFPVSPDGQRYRENFTLHLLRDPARYTNMECEIVRKDKSKAWVAYTNKLHTDKHGKILEVLSIGNDITRLKTAEENSRINRGQLELVNKKLQEKNRTLDAVNAQLRDLNKQKTEFVSMASHELRTPLTGIVGFAETLQAPDMAFSEDEKRHFLHIIEMEGKRLAGILGDLLDVSKIESGVSEMNLTELNLASLIDETVEMMKRKKPIAIEKHLSPPHVSTILGDCNRLKQVFVNLLDNAMRYAPPDGVIRIETTPQDSLLRVAVRDQGSGISPELLPKVFDKFVRAKDGGMSGSGLGLAIAKSIVEAHGGSIWVDSEMQQGTTFYFTLPRKT
ncbi:MAG: ATP-binding protein [Chitinivibrionales bacterium]